MNLISLVAIVIGLVLLAFVAVRAIGGNITLVDDWKKSWKFYSTWGMVFVAALPDLWNAVVAGGYLEDQIPDSFSWAVKLSLLVTFLVKQIAQLKKPELPDFGKS